MFFGPFSFFFENLLFLNDCNHCFFLMLFNLLSNFLCFLLKKMIKVQNKYFLPVISVSSILFCRLFTSCHSSLSGIIALTYLVAAFLFFPCLLFFLLQFTVQALCFVSPVLFFVQL